MANFQSGGAFLPGADYNPKGTWQFDGSISTTGGVAASGGFTLNVQSVTAAGTNQATAGAITAVAPAIVVVTAADTTKGAVLPSATAGALLFVKNSVTNADLPIYPASGQIINALSSNSSYALAGAKAAVFACRTAGTWFTILTA